MLAVLTLYTGPDGKSEVSFTVNGRMVEEPFALVSPQLDLVAVKRGDTPEARVLLANGLMDIGLYELNLLALPPKEAADAQPTPEPQTPAPLPVPEPPL